MEVDSGSNYTPEERATYQKIKVYVKEQYGVNVHTFYIAQVKRMCGLDMGENYNKSKKENPEVKQCSLNWVSIDTIKYYIQTNMYSAEECKLLQGYEMMERIDFLCRKINELLPETLEYYTFPKEWEEAGIGDMIRSLYGISANYR